MNAGLLIARSVVGLTVAAHGVQKLFGWFGGGGLQATGRSFDRLGFRPGTAFAVIAGSCEAGGGLLLAVGLLTPLAAAIVMGTMLNAALSVHVKNGFWLQKKGWEYTFVIGGVAAGLAFTGPGAYGLDHAAGWTLSGAGWGGAALGTALLVGVATDLYRRRVLAADRGGSE